MVTVDNVNWTESEVVKMSRDSFMATFMADDHTYPMHTEARKLAALGAVYDMCVPPTIQADIKPNKGGKVGHELGLDAPDAE